MHPLDPIPSFRSIFPSRSPLIHPIPHLLPLQVAAHLMQGVCGYCGSPADIDFAAFLLKTLTARGNNFHDFSENMGI